MKKCMDLNKETANQLWVQQFGKEQKTNDFAGREIIKSAYNDRNSKYGWNVDHILPLSRGGKTVDYNLICCHILTNNEKADKFPCFKANTKEFEIKKRKHHYEITTKTVVQRNKGEKTINFLDASQGLKCWKQCKADNRGVFVGYVKIRVDLSNQSNQLLERYGKFLIELFGKERIFAKDDGCSSSYYRNGYNRSYIFTVIVGDVPTKEDSENLLDHCIILNTYSKYFIRNTGFENIQIVCGAECYDSRFEMSLNCQKDILEKRVQFIDSLAIDEFVRIHTSAKKELNSGFSKNGFYPYDFIFTQLDKILNNMGNKG